MLNNIIKLEDISNFITSSKDTIELNKHDIFDLLEITGNIIDDYVQLNILSFSNPNFHDDLKQSCFDLLSFQLNNIHIVNIDNELNYVIEKAHNIYFSKIVPFRSYNYTFIRKEPNVDKMYEKIQYLRNIPQPEQRTTDWYKYRYNLITASNAWKALDSQSSVNSLIYEKCMPLNLEKYDNLNTDTPFHWGQKYEPLSIMFYESRYNTKVEDFGCLQCQKNKFLGASPDGINVDESSDLFGRMLEVKNIVNREITGIPKREYWCQMQIQMGVCNLNECDFLETRFIEYEDEEAFNDDGTFQFTINNEVKGVFMYFVKDGKAIYEYPELYITKDEFETWEEEMMIKHDDKMWVKNIYWRLDQLSCVLVLRNKLWFNEAVIHFEKVWNIIEHERINGYDHRAPIKREKKIKDVVVVEKTQCLINTEKVLNIKKDDDDVSELHDNIENNKTSFKREQPRSLSFNENSEKKIIKIRSLSLDETKIK